MKKLALGLAALAALGAGAASAWEAASTNAGLTEAAAMGSGLHLRLEQQFGLELGLYAGLTIPPEAAPALYEHLARLEPSEGYVPNKKGKQTAGSWLVAGAVLEEIPGGRGRHHFYDPVAKQGLTGRGIAGLRKLVERRALAAAAQGGTAAPDWIVAKENEFGHARFLAELELAVTAKSAAERELHLATALLCAGAMTAVLEDVGSPSRARDDLAEHVMPLGGGASDRGSRFERLATLVYGRIGVPVPKKPVARVKLRDFFTAEDGHGLADVTNKSWYSSGTLPGALNVAERPAPGALPKRVIAAQRYPLPAPSGELDLAAAAEAGAGARLENARGVCLARYRFDGGWLRWSIDDRCAAEQLAVILPEVAAYAAGFIDFLFRGALEVDPDGAVRVAGVALGEGTLTILAEDESGTRTAVGQPIAVKGGKPGKELGRPASVPAGAKRVAAVFTGVDANGEAVVAAGVSESLE